MIRFENVSATYPRHTKPALKDVTAEIDKGEFVFLVGESGSGKSTFLRLVLRETRATEGRVYVAGKELNRLASWKVPALRRQIGTVFQDFRLLQNKTVAQNVAFALQVIGKPRATTPSLYARGTSVSRDGAPNGIGRPSLSTKMLSRPGSFAAGTRGEWSLASVAM